MPWLIAWSRRMRCAQSGGPSETLLRKGCAAAPIPGLGDTHHSGPETAQAGLTRACRGEPIGRSSSHRSAAARGERRGANQSAGARTGTDHTRRAESGRREPRAGAELRRSRDKPRRDAGTEDAEAQKRESRQNQRERILDRRLIAAKTLKPWVN